MIRFKISFANLREFDLKSHCDLILILLTLGNLRIILD